MGMSQDMKKMKWVALLVSMMLPLAASAGGSVAEGQKKAETCKACHGEGGLKPIQPDYPVIGGQHREYLVAALKQYKSGKRKNASMNGFAAALKPQDIEDLAAYYASQRSPLKMKY
jgi:cytochrome c553